MSSFLMYRDSTSTTGRALVDWLREHDVDIEGGTSTGDRRYDKVIRWGSVASTPLKPGRVINARAAILKASDKQQALMDVQAAGLSVPRIWSAESRDIQFPCLGRQVNHHGGTDIQLCLQMFDVRRAIREDNPNKSAYFVQYIPVKTEYRIHVWQERVIKKSEKVLTDEAKYQPWVRNFEGGFTFRQPGERVPATVQFLAVQAVELFGLDFGAVDIILGDDGRAYFLEVNTAAGLTVDSSLEAYGTKMMEELSN